MKTPSNLENVHWGWSLKFEYKAPPEVPGVWRRLRIPGKLTAAARGRYQNSPQYQQNKPKLLSYQENDAAFVPAAATYDDRQSRFSTATVPVVKPRAISPDPRPMRKSVSPSPRPSDDTRRLSGIPFGPDSYNALNPSLAGSASTPSLSAAYDTKIIDPDAKIITSTHEKEKRGPENVDQKKEPEKPYHHGVEARRGGAVACAPAG